MRNFQSSSTLSRTGRPTARVHTQIPDDPTPLTILLPILFFLTFFREFLSNEKQDCQPYTSLSTSHRECRSADHSRRHQQSSPSPAPPPTHALAEHKGMPSALAEHGAMSEVARDVAAAGAGSGRQDAVAAAARARADAADQAARRKTWTFDYVWRSGVAGGIAGCAVRFYCPCRSLLCCPCTDHVASRPRPLSHPSTGSRSFSRRATLSSQNIPDHGSVSLQQ